MLVLNRHSQVHKDAQDNHCAEKLRPFYQEVWQVGQVGASREGCAAQQVWDQSPVLG